MNNVEQARILFFEALASIDVSDFRNAELRLLQGLQFAPESASILTNLAVVLLRQDKRIEALAYAEKAIAAKPENIEALLVLADCYAKNEKFDESLTTYKKIECLNPNLAEVHNNIGFILAKARKFEDAIASYDRALTIEPDFGDAHNNRGNALFKLGRYSEARISYQHALKFNPDLFEAARALVYLLLFESNFAGALEVARLALTRNKSNEAKHLVVSCLCSPLANPNVDLRDLLLQSISDPWTRPAQMSSTCARFLVLNDTIRNGLERIAKLAPQSGSAEELIDPSATCISALAEDHLFCAMLELTPICDVLLERFVTGRRFQLLGAARSTATTEVSAPLLTIYCAIARQCFINNYVFDHADEEIEQAQALRDTLISSIESETAVPILSLIAVAAYFPLYSLPRAESLLDGQWPAVVKDLLAQQISAPIEEGKLRSSMPALTAINDSVSMQVRDQYEESPYPQWVKAAPGPNPVTVDEFITKKFPHSSFIKLKKHTGIDILVAGCGTGQHSIETA